MPIKRPLLFLQIAAVVASQIAMACSANVSADSGHNCNDVEVHFVEGYGWGPGPVIRLPSTKDSHAFARQIKN